MHIRRAPATSARPQSPDRDAHRHRRPAAARRRGRGDARHLAHATVSRYTDRETTANAFACHAPLPAEHRAHRPRTSRHGRTTTHYPAVGCSAGCGPAPTPPRLRRARATSAHPPCPSYRRQLAEPAQLHAQAEPAQARASADARTATRIREARIATRTDTGGPPLRDDRGRGDTRHLTPHIRLTPRGPRDDRNRTRVMRLRRRT